MTRRQILIRTLKRAAAFAALFVSGPALAQDVTLTSTGGALTVTGRVIGFDGEYLQIESPYGPLTVNYESVSCTGDRCPDPATYVPLIRLSGASAMAEILIPALIEGFARDQGVSVTISQTEPAFVELALGDGTARFLVHATTSEEGFADLITFQSDMALSNREVRPSEQDRAVEVGIGRLDQPGQSRIVGLGALVPVVSPAQSVDSLSMDDLSRAFAGRVENWSQLGGADVPITLHMGPQKDGAVQFFLDHVVRAAGHRPAASIEYHDRAEDLLAAVINQPGALGIAGIGKTGNTRVLALRDSCGYYARPDQVTLKSLEYPLTTPLFVYLPDWRLHSVAQEFLAYLQTASAQLIVRRAGYTDQGVVAIPLDAQGQRFASAISEAGPEIDLSELQRMVRVMQPLTRQSVSFRFEEGSTRLDAASRSQLLLLAQALRDGHYKGRTLWMIGFTDGRGAATANRDLSSARAEAVKQDLIAVLGRSLPEVVIETEAFGEALPMACDDSLWGRQMNRRVELWVSE